MHTDTMSDTDRKRFDDFIHRHSDPIQSLYLRRSRGDRVFCRDLVQECYIYLWRYFPALSPDATPIQQSYWVYWRCRSLFSHLARQKNNLQFVAFIQLLDPNLLLSAVDPTNEDVALASQQRDYIRSVWCAALRGVKSRACRQDECKLNDNNSHSTLFRHTPCTKQQLCFYRNGRNMFFILSVTVTLEGAALPAEITVYDAAGHAVLERRAATRRTRLSTRSLPAGHYFVTVATPRGTATQKLTIL